jgi:pantetheine-phosphate adenylyltransferase
MKKFFVLYPGSFCPPTYGHFNIVLKAHNLFGKLTILCSENPGKECWFTQEDCQAMWSAYDLPEDVSVETFNALTGRGFDPEEIVMVRGIRSPEDFDDEKKVAMYNNEMFDISQFMYLKCEKSLECISSSAARKAAQNLDFLDFPRYVPPTIVTKLLEKALGIQNIFMVVGKTGSGKSALLKRLNRLDEKNINLNTDPFSEILKPILQNHFGKDADLVQLAISNNEEVSKLLAKEWFRLLGKEMLKVPKGSNVFVEIPYGLRPGKDMYRFLGSKLIYVGCNNESINNQRVIKRKTQEHLPFVNSIPGLEETREIARINKLKLTEIDTSGSLEDLDLIAKDFNDKLKGDKL